MATAAETSPVPDSPAAIRRRDADARRFRGGWRIVAAKELGDHVRSVRFILLVVIVGLAGMAAVNSAANTIRDQAENASQIPSFFLLLFTLSPDRVPAFFDLVAFLGPLLGIAFGFDALSSERSQRTLPRLVSQPIHRDDVIMGKFVAGITAIALALFVFVAVVSGFGLFRIGLVPGWSAVARLVAYLTVALAYIGFWLALSILLSTVFRRGATAALATIAVWLVFTLFWSLITGVVADTFKPVHDDQNIEQVLANARFEQTISRLSPTKLYDEATQVLLKPNIRVTGIPSVSQVSQSQYAIPNPLPLDQSLLVAWPQWVALIAGTVVIFAVAYTGFLRQEIRA